LNKFTPCRPFDEFPNPPDVRHPHFCNS
jgi:hypothetical protein